MPPKKRSTPEQVSQLPVQETAKRQRTSAQVSVPKKKEPPALLNTSSITSSLGNTSYENFLKMFIQGLGLKEGQKLPTGIDNISNWPKPDDSTDVGKIQQEIAKKFVTNPVFNKLDTQYVHKVSGVNDDNHYRPERFGAFKKDSAQPYIAKMRLQRLNSQAAGPDPRVVTHELVHANDHQRDNLNTKVWQNLHNLNRQSTDFNTSLSRIQNKIDPTKGFSTAYPFEENAIKEQIEKARSGYGLSEPTSTNPNLFDQIQQITNHQLNIIPSRSLTDTAINLANPGFHLPFASEFPAFMSERLTNNWNTNQGQENEILSQPEAKFLYETLGNMAAAYPESMYPTTNKHILARRDSINDAYGSVFDSSSGSSSPATPSSSTYSGPTDNADTFSTGDDTNPIPEKKGGLVRSKSRNYNNKQGISNFLKKLNNYKRINFINAHQYR